MVSRRVLIWGAALVLVSLLAIGCNTYLRYQGWAASRQTPVALSEQLRASYRIFMPSGRGPWPTAILFSGCDGPKDNMKRWASALNDLGWGAVVVDSHNPRGYDDAQIWRLICAGQLLTGGERAGDVAVAFDDVRNLAEVDPKRIVLIGSSHGGWSILDMMSLHSAGQLPYNLTRWPDAIRDEGLDGISGVVLLYPYCGAGSQVSRKGWGEDIPVLFLLVDDDTIADEESCLRLADRMKEQGRPTEIHVLRGTTHGFDQAEKSFLSALEFSPEATQEALSVVDGFLQGLEQK